MPFFGVFKFLWKNKGSLSSKIAVKLFATMEVFKVYHFFGVCSF